MRLALALAILSCTLAPASSHAADPNKPHAHQGIAPKFTSRPAPQSLTAADEATLSSGQPVLKQVRYETGGRGVAVMDVHAAPDRIWTIIQDFPSYPQWVDKLEKCTPYKRAGEHIYVQFNLSVYTVDVEYYIDHTYRPQQGYMSWQLDYSRQSDLDDSTGYWMVYPAPGKDGWSRVEYTVDLRLSGWVPKVIEDMLAKKGLVMATSWVKKQAEAP